MAADPYPLVDSFGRRHTYLRISLTERCNFRCTYCMPEEGIQLSPRSAILSFEEIERLARLFVKLGVEKIRLTGGEPLVRKHAEVLAGRLGTIDGLRTLALTTNGMLLLPKMEALLEAGLKQVNISLDTLHEERFQRIARRPGLQRVLATIDAAAAIETLETKVNCVVMRGVNDDELLDFVELARERPVDVRFIEYMPFLGNGWGEAGFVSYDEMLSTVRNVHPELQPIGRPDTGTAHRFTIPGYAGSLGFISSMSDAFCGSCNRLRLTADGNLKVCLFGAAEVSLRDAMRGGASDDELVALISAAVDRKKAAHAGMTNLPDMENRPMILIGG